ncbi:hypothetical protein HanIR_Chr11g0504371 [Helianthus annuus]|nr:hypothetical protein HanIR_Chr11g0504371 [Helianthus annuus]
MNENLVESGLSKSKSVKAGLFKIQHFTFQFVDLESTTIYLSIYVTLTTFDMLGMFGTSSWWLVARS